MNIGMLERVVRVLAAKRGDIKWRSYQSEARVVLETLREPTEAMIEAGYLGPNPTMEPDHPRFVWQAMIDSALEQNTPNLKTAKPSKALEE